VNDTCVSGTKRVRRTARFFGLGEQTLLERSLLLQVLQTLVEIRFPQLGPSFGRIILGEDTMSIGVENDERIDGI
jgi:hypothetical protein